jgi:hypothetical protein
MEALDVESRPDFIDFMAYDMMTQMKAFVKFELTPNKFGVDMGKYVDAGCIVKKRASGGKGNKYTVYPALIKKFMTDKMWFTEI